MAVAGPDRGRTAAGGRVERRGRVVELGEHRLGPAGGDQPGAVGPCRPVGGCALGDQLQRRGAGRCVADIDAQAVQRPG